MTAAGEQDARPSARQPHRLLAETPPAPTPIAMTGLTTGRRAFYYSATAEELTARPGYWPRRANDRPAARPPFRLARD